MLQGTSWILKISQIGTAVSSFFFEAGSQGDLGEVSFKSVWNKGTPRKRQRKVKGREQENFCDPHWCPLYCTKLLLVRDVLDLQEICWIECEYNQTLSGASGTPCEWCLWPRLWFGCFKSHHLSAKSFLALANGLPVWQVWRSSIASFFLVFPLALFTHWTVAESPTWLHL